jgi:molecular chaperone IbpA
MRILDFAPLSRFTIGFDRLFDLLGQASHLGLDDSFPSYDIEKTGEDTYRVTLAVPGFTSDDISIESQPNMLVVSGRKSRDQGGQALHRGIAVRSFERRFNLADFV